MADRKKFRLSLATLITICILLTLVLSAQMQSADEPLLTTSSDGESSGPAVNDTPTGWFVELSSAPAAEGTSITTLRNEKNAFRKAARQAGVNFTERYAFDTLWNGISIKIAPSQLASLARVSGVKALYPIEKVSIPEPIDSGDEIELFTALAQTGADVAQNSLGLSGAGVRVGIIDTGLDIDHPAFGGGGIRGGTSFPTARVASGFDFVGDNYNSSGTGAQLTPVPDPNPDDCAGHGTHVAGIAGANGQVKGVAPGVTFGAYRVFGCVGTTDSDIMIAAMERALADDMQVVNMSIGSSFQWPQYPTAQAATRLVNKGVVVVCSIGNSGPNGVWSSSAPGVGSKVIGVASFNNTHNNSPYFTVSPDNRINIYNPATNGTAAIPSSGSFPMLRTGTTASAADACAPLPAGSLTGAVALIRRGTCGFYDKSTNAQNAGAVGVVIYNNQAGTIIPNIAPAPAGNPVVAIPVVAITSADGAVIDGRIAAGPVTMTWTNQFASTTISTGNLISSFSSYGLSPDLTVKPDIGAPGGNIRSTVPIEQGSTGINSGTSMSSPHVAGAVALLLEARPNTSSQEVRDILQNSADPKLWSGNPGLGFLELVHRQGAGMLDIPGAILSQTLIRPGKIALGESEFGPVTRTLTVANDGPNAVIYDLSHAPALATNGTFTISFFNAPSTVAFSQLGVPVTSITVPAGGSGSVDVTTSPNAGLADRSLFGGYVVLTPQGGGATYRVPFAGIKGDYQSIQVLVPTASNFPRMATNTSGNNFTFLPVGSGGTWTLQTPQQIPFVALHLDHQSRRIRMEVFDANSGTYWHRALDLEYFGRNSTAGGFFAFPWDGTTFHGAKNGLKVVTVPDGQYVIKLSVFKALGDDSNPAHVETWTSPVITIDRP